MIPNRLRQWIPPLPAGTGRRWLLALATLGLIQLGLYARLLFLSSHFAPEQNPGPHRPILPTLALLGTAFLLYLASFSLVRKIAHDKSDAALSLSRWALLIVLSFSFLFRLVLWPSHPIQADNVYRYLWDGRVVIEGIAPYRFSPADVDRYGDSLSAPADLLRLAVIRDSSPALRFIFSRIERREVPTVYPPVSQAVFAVAAWITPPDAPMPVHLWIIKAMILAFDCGTIYFLVAILRELAWRPSLVLAYAWCPLILKEFANSGRLDSIAVCLLTATAWLMVRSVGPGWKSADISGETESRAFVTGLLFGIAILAKLFPIVLLPLFFRWWWHHIGRRVAFPLVGCFLVLGTVYGPLLDQAYRARTKSTVGVNPTPLLPSRHPFDGFIPYLDVAEQNDLLFAVVRENLELKPKPSPSPTLPSATYSPWFAVTPQPWRLHLHQLATRSLHALGFDASKARIPSLLARLFTSLTFVLIALWLALRPARIEDPRLELLRATFLTLAWLWYLSAPQNPWYWSWALPFLLFARPCWQIVSGTALLFYLRVWLVQQFPDQPLWNLYPGGLFFDWIVTWIEHLPFLLLLATLALTGQKQRPA